MKCIYTRCSALREFWRAKTCVAIQKRKSGKRRKKKSGESIIATAIFMRVVIISIYSWGLSAGKLPQNTEKLYGTILQAQGINNFVSLFFLILSFVNFLD